MRFLKLGQDDAREPKPLSATSRRLAVHFVGTVQGVGFRWTCRQIAGELGLTGWVRNEHDGSVSLEIQGEGQDIAVFFTELTNNYQNMRFPIRFTIDQKDDIALIPGEKDFTVAF